MGKTGGHPSQHCPVQTHLGSFNHHFSLFQVGLPGSTFFEMKCFVLLCCLSALISARAQNVAHVEERNSLEVRNSLEKRNSVEARRGIFDVFKDNFPKEIYDSFSNTATQQQGHITTAITFVFTSLGWLLSAQIYSLMMGETAPAGREEDTMNLENVFGEIMSPQTAAGEIGGGLVISTFSILLWFLVILIFRDDSGSREKKENESGTEAKTIEYSGFDIVSFIEQFPDHIKKIFSWKSVGMTIGFNLWGLMSMQLFWFLASFLPKNAMRKKREISSDMNQFDNTSYSPYNKEMVSKVFKDLYKANNKYIKEEENDQAQEQISRAPLHRRKYLQRRKIQLEIN